MGVPFREVQQGNQGAAFLMAALLRPTSSSYFRLVVGLLISAVCVAAVHWVLFPMDPLFVLSGGCGAFAYVAVVGSSHHIMWYTGVTPFLALLVLPNCAPYMKSLERKNDEQPRVRRR